MSCKTHYFLINVEIIFYYNFYSLLGHLVANLVTKIAMNVLEIKKIIVHNGNTFY